MVPFRKKSEVDESDLPIDVAKKTERRFKRGSEKPWGRKERVIILFVLLGTIGVSSTLALSSRSWKLPGFPRIKMPTFSRISLLSNEVVVIEGSKDNLEKSQRIISNFDLLTNNLSGVYGLYIVHLTDGYSFGVNKSDIFEPASLNKLPVILSAYRQAEKGEFDLDEEYTLKESDKIKGSGTLRTMPEGTVLTYRELLNLMGKKSDNTAFGIVRNVLGEKVINQTIHEVGMKNTSIEDNVTTPLDIGTFFEKIYRGGIVSNEAGKEILMSLTDTIYEDYLPVGVSMDVRVAHKYGREVNVINDAGVVYGREPYVVVVLSKGIIENEANVVIPQISKMIYETLSVR